jgi:hypothetical protein
MGTSEHIDLSALRTRVVALTEQEGVLLAEALALSRVPGARSKVDLLFAQAQSVQIERSGLKKQIAQLLGTRRLHLGPEVWQTGLYDYTPPDGAGPVRVRVIRAPLGLHVEMQEGRTVRIETLPGSFEGPVAAEG